MSARYSIVRDDRIDYSAWLIFSEDGELRLVRGRPSLARSERAAKLELTVPLALWKTPELKVSIEIKDPGVAAVELSAAAETIAEAIAGGCDLTVRVIAEPEE